MGNNWWADKFVHIPDTVRTRFFRIRMTRGGLEFRMTVLDGRGYEKASATQTANWRMQMAMTLKDEISRRIIRDALAEVEQKLNMVLDKNIEMWR